MRFSSFDIHNFKGIGDISLDLESGSVTGVTTLVGLNESGKTTVLQGINFFQDDDIPEGKQHTLIPKKDKFRFDDKVSVVATLTLDDQDEEAVRSFAESQGYIVHESHKLVRIKISKSYQFKNSQFQKSSSYYTYDFKLVGKKKKSSKKEYVELDKNDALYRLVGDYIKESLCPKIIYYQNFLFDFPEKIYLDSWTDDKPQQKFYRQILQDILHSIDSRLSLDSDVLSKMKSGADEDKEALEHTISLMGSKITQEVLTTWGQIFDWNNKQISIKHSSEDKKYTEKETGELKKAKRYYVEFELKEGAQPYKIPERSLGFNWFFAFLLFTQFRKSRSTDPGETLFLLDEPASNLHSSAQLKVTTVFEKLSDASKLVFSTHSHHLIRPDWLEGAYIVQNAAIKYDSKQVDYDTTKTNIILTPYKQFVAKNPKQSSYFQPILDSLDYKPSDLEMVPEITIFEGKNDFYTFKYAVDVLFPGEYKLNFYPGGGAGKNGGVIRLYESWGRNYSVMLDGDYAGTNAVKKYTEDIGPIIDNKIYSLGDIKNGWKNKTTEDIFYPSDQLKVIAAIDPKQKKYSKSKFNLGIQHLLFTKNKLDLTKTTEANLREVLDYIVSRLMR